MQFTSILFDLDGTLTDPKIGVTRSIQYALEKMGRPVPDQKDLLWCIGPPLMGSFEKLLGEDGRLANKALGLYRERFGEVGKFENEVYADIPETLKRLRQRGLRLYLSTSKPLVFAREIITHFGLGSCFNGLYGSRLDGGLNDKGELIAHILRQESLSAEEAIMVGDRKYDIIGARQNGLASCGVTYGYGSEEELRSAGADHIAATPLDIDAIIGDGVVVR
jgi:phosphoglycolate phosphatase